MLLLISASSVTIYNQQRNANMHALHCRFCIGEHACRLVLFLMAHVLSSLNIMVMIIVSAVVAGNKVNVFSKDYVA